MTTANSKRGDALRHEQQAVVHDRQAAQYSAQMATKRRSLSDAQRGLERAEEAERKRRTAETVRQLRVDQARIRDLSRMTRPLARFAAEPSAPETVGQTPLFIGSPARRTPTRRRRSGGKVLGGRWEIIKPLYEGGQAHTFLVRDLNDRSEGWVLKRLKNLKRVERFRREIEALSTIESANIPRVVDYQFESGPAYMVSPYVGIDLSRSADLPTDAAGALGLLRQIASAARDAHGAGIVHRDVKPDNIVIEDGVAYLVDFGICADSSAGVVLTTTAEGFGNRAFAPPECEPGSIDAATPASDIYSLGKVLYWITASRRLIFASALTQPHWLLVTSMHATTSHC